MSVQAKAGSLVVMAKVPGLAAKTRLAPRLNDAQREWLATAFLQDKASQLNALGRAYAVAVAPPEAPEAMRPIVGPTAELFAQVGTEFGDRLRAALEKKFADGADWVALVDGDTPTLPTSSLIEACTALDSGTQIVIGPAWDGGYYFIGFSRKTALAEFFTDMPWSTCEVFSKTMQRARAAGLNIHVLPAWYDVDTGTDLERLEDELRYATADMPGYAAATADALRRIARSGAK